MLKQINEHVPSQHCLDTLHTDAFIYADPLLRHREFYQLAFVRRQRSTFAHQTVSQRGPRPLSLSIDRGHAAS